MDFSQAATDQQRRRGEPGRRRGDAEPNTGSPKWAIGDLDQQTFFVIDKLRAAQISKAQLMTLPDGSQATG